MKNESEEDIGQLNVGEEEAKVDIYNSSNEPSNLEKGNENSSNRFTMVDKNFDEEESRDNSLGLDKLRPTAISSYSDEINVNDINMNNSVPVSNRVTKNFISRDLNLINLKIILIGDVAVGKTSIVGRYIDNSYHDRCLASIQAEKRSKILKHDEDTSFRLYIWDTAGQEKFKSVTRQYYRNCHGAIIVFDLTNKKTFDELNKWIKEVKNHAREDTVIIILGNKSDLTEERAIFEHEIKEELNNEYFYLDVSAKTGNNISLAFDKLVKLIFEKMKMKGKNKKGKNEEKVKKKQLNDEEINNKEIYEDKGKSKKCC